MNILKKADEIVNQRSEEKERMYGPFSESMERATAIYNASSPEDEKISVRGMYRAMVALKLSREAFSHKEDNLLDAVAYLGALNNYIEKKPEYTAEKKPEYTAEKKPEYTVTEEQLVQLRFTPNIAP